MRATLLKYSTSRLRVPALALALLALVLWER
jgi:hypothetical protein